MVHEFENVPFSSFSWTDHGDSLPSWLLCSLQDNNLVWFFISHCKSLLFYRLAVINRCFSRRTIEEIFSALVSWPHGFLCERNLIPISADTYIHTSFSLSSLSLYIYTWISLFLNQILISVGSGERSYK